MVKILFLILFLSITNTTAFAQLSIDNSKINTRKTTKTHADVWSITPKEWMRYEEIMEYKGKYFWDHLDPITVLALNARTEKERNKYAILLAKQEFNNTTNTILLDRAYQAAFQKLYGHIPLIDDSRLENRPLSNIASNDNNFSGFGNRYILFVSTKCRKCDFLVQNTLNQMSLGTSIDIHFKQDTRKEITEWAARQNISRKAVSIGSITLNPNSKLFETFGNPSIPSIFYFDNKTNEVKEVK